jgi:peptidoglycan/xylan/chitin deacetylase (PgdA/CDA1 family)
MFGFRDRLAILMYHRVLSQPNPLRAWDVDADTFNWQMETLHRYFNVLPLRTAVERLQHRTLPARAVCITFDDGYADNFEVALPILQRYGLNATFFIATGYLDGGRMWNDTVVEAVVKASGELLDLESLGLPRFSVATMAERAQVIQTLLGQLKYLPAQDRVQMSAAIAAHVGKPLPTNLMMTTPQLRALHATGMEIGAHTVQHPILTKVSDVDAEHDIVASRQRLGELLGSQVKTFAYPNGQPGKDYNSRHVEMVRRAGFEIAVSTAWGCASPTMDTLQLARIAPWDRTPMRFALRIFRSYLGAPAALV